MSKVSVECPLRTVKRCGSICVFEAGTTRLGKAIRDKDPRSTTQETSKILRRTMQKIGA